MLKTAIEAAKKAGDALREAAKGPIVVDQMKAFDVKLEMDRRCEDIILDTIRARFPGHGSLSEEAGANHADAEYVWIIDPLDGSSNYLSRIPFYCVSIGLRRGHETVLGVVYDPCREELFTAEKGQGAFVNNQLIRPSGNSDMARSLVAYGLVHDKQLVPKGVDWFTRVVRHARSVRNLGSAALHLAYVACGRVDAFFVYGLSLWDVAAGSLLVEEAGGTVITKERGENCLDIIAGSEALCRQLEELRDEST